jgi:hypothetical protein
LAPAKWVGPGGSALAGNYTYELVIKLPRCIIPAQVTISARVAADNSERVLVDGLQVAQYTGDFGFLTQNIVGFNSPPPPLGPGTHAIQVIVNNESRASGVVLNGLIRIACPKESAGSLSVDPATGWSGRRAQPSKGRPKS